MSVARARGGLTVLYAAFLLRLLLVPLSYFLPALAVRADWVGRAITFAPLPVTALTLIGFLMLGRGDERSALFAQLTAALLSTELLFDLVLLIDGRALGTLQGFVYLIESLWILIALAGWSALRHLAVERGATPPAALSLLFYFALATRVGLYAQRAMTHRGPIDLRHLDGAAATSVLISLALPLLELLLTGAARRASPRT